MEPTPADRMHHWLRQLVGHWDVSATCTLPDGSTETAESKETVRMVGDYFAVAELIGEVPGAEGPIETHFTVGYDPDKNVFPACWYCSAMPRLFTYEGTLSEDETTLTLECEAPDMEDMSVERNYRDVITIVSATERTFHTEVQNDDGSWHRFMWSTYTKTNH